MGSAELGLIVCACLFGAAMAALMLHPRLPPALRDERTHDVIKLAVGMVVVMTSLVLGLLTASVKGSFDAVDRGVHQFATQLILLDRALRLYGPEADGARGLLTRYTERALGGLWPPGGGPVLVEDPAGGDLLDQVERAVDSLQPEDERRRQVKADAEGRLRGVVEQRWALIEQAGGTLSTLLLAVLVAWLTLIFASFGYNAPNNRTVVGALLLCTVSIAAALLLIVEMDDPFGGYMTVSREPMQRALDYIRR